MELSFIELFFAVLKDIADVSIQDQAFRFQVFPEMVENSSRFFGEPFFIWLLLHLIILLIIKSQLKLSDIINSDQQLEWEISGANKKKGGENN